MSGGIGQSRPLTSSSSKRALIYLRVSTARQATQGGEAEGYSIPAQRAACQKKAAELGAAVVDEYVDAGASARSADRDALQAMLSRLLESRDADYVIVHKVDRLARDRADDVAIGLAIHKAGAVLVSATEQIDDTPAGTLLHGIMAAIAEFYSKNLSNEAKKGLHEKARRGGTPGYAPLGYLNSRARIDEREVKTIELNPERAPHIKWAFESYASGDYSITDIVEELARRGMHTRPTTTRTAKPLTRSQVHRILSSPYYVGKLRYKDVEYNATHESLVDLVTWQCVQDVLAGRRLAGDRSWQHDHYLKGTVFCANCGSRLGLSHSKGSKGVIYPHYYCIGRNKKRSDCLLPYIAVDKVEQFVLRHWATIRLDPELIQAIRDSVQTDFAERRAEDAKLQQTQKSRLTKLERQREKLIDAYLAEALPVADLKRRQEALAVEQRDAERLLALAGADHDLAEQRLEVALQLLAQCDRLYAGAGESDRRALNQAFFDAVFVNEHGVQRAVLASPFAELHDRSIGLAEDDGPDDGGDDNAQDGPEPDGRTDQRPDTETHPDKPRVRRTTPRNTNAAALSGERRSNVMLLAEGVGFEPTDSFLSSAFKALALGHYANPPERDPRDPTWPNSGRGRRGTGARTVPR